MLKAFLFGFIIAIFLLVVAGAALVPFYGYNLVLQSGIDVGMLSIRTPTSNDFTLPKGKLEKGEESDDSRFWKDFHFQNMVVPLPIRHPQVTALPIVEGITKDKRPNIGVAYAGRSFETFFSFKCDEPQKFDLSFAHQKIFKLPIFENMLLQVPLPKIYQDMLDMTIKPIAPYQLAISSIKKSSYLAAISELVYNLYILDLRQRNFALVTANGKQKLEVIRNDLLKVTMEESDPRYRKVKLLLIANNEILPMSVRVRSETIMGEGIASRFIKGLSFKATDKEASFLIYAEYNKLSYEEKIDHDGMTYLLASWSHRTEDQLFLKQMIQYMEKGKDNKLHLNPFYKYGYERFGSSFSTKADELLETAEQGLSRKVNEEFQKEMKDAAKSDGLTPDTFESEEKKTEYNLRKVKESKINDDENERVLTQ